MAKRRVHVIGVDPGKHCGLARLYGDEHTSVIVEPDQVVTVLRDWFEDGPAIVCCERFVIGGQTVRKTRQNDVLDVIGAVQALCTDHEFIFDLQSAGDAKRMGNRAVLEILHWYRSGHELDHANDASSHVILGLARHHPEVINRLIA